MKNFISPVKEKNTVKNLWENSQGRVAVPILLWFMGVPGFFVFFLWLFFFRGNGH